MTKQSDKKPDAPDEIWYNEVPGYSPEIEPSPVSPHMVFTCAAANGAQGDTTALFAGFNLGWPYTELYGGQLPAPINIVAVNLFTGDTFFSPSAHSNNSIMQPVQLYLSNAELNSGEPEFNRSFVNAWFNADMPRLLCLPPEDALYGVSLWIDDLITPIQVVQVGGNQKRPTPPTTPVKVDNSNLVSIQKSSHSPKPVDGEIRLDGPLAEARNRIYGTLPNNVFTSPPVPMEGATPILTLMGFTQRSRRFFWYSDTKFYDTAKKGDIFNFNFDPFQLIEQPERPESLFIVAQLGTIRSEALWIPSELSMGG